MARNSSLLALVLIAQVASLWSTARAATPQDAPNLNRIPVYAAADENSVVLGSLSGGEKPTPLAESRSAGGIRWYLVKTTSGVVGWVKETDHEQSKSIANFFRSLPAEPVTLATEPSIGSPIAARTGAVSIPIRVNGRAVIVPVTFNRSVETNLLLDTGASMTMISRRVAAALALPATGTALLAGIGGTVNVPILRVASVQVGVVEVNDMAVSVHDLSRSAPFEGLLGMDFLGRFDVAVDSVKKLLVLAPK